LGTKDRKLAEWRPHVSDELHHECGVAALYWLSEPVGQAGSASERVHEGDVTPLMPMVLLNLQNRGQLAAGLSRYNPDRPQILDTFKDIGSVAEAFRMSHPAKYEAILKEYAGRACIGHTRYATCGADDARYAQPFERHHGRLWKWYSFAFNGNLANYADLRSQLLSRRHYVFTLNTDTEMIMHELSYRLRGDQLPDLAESFAGMSEDFDGAYNIVFLDAMGRMVVARDPLGLRPMCYAVQGRLFAAASESVALKNLGFSQICSLPPGEMAVIEDGKLRFERFAPKDKSRIAHCFFEWIYFSNVASEMDGADVYSVRARSGQMLADREEQEINGDCIVVPVPDTAKAAADAYAYRLGIPSVEGLIRNRYVGRTFIQSGSTRKRSASTKYTPLPAVLEGKRVFLVEDSIVRSTTLRALVDRIRSEGRAREVHVRVACPPIVAPCFYGIDMSTLDELFAPEFVGEDYCGEPTPEQFAKMAESLKIDSLRYLNVSDLGECIGLENENLCLGCVTGSYPSCWGNKLMASARRNVGSGKAGRTYE
jgi:amidophosphoribosyltransferase